MGEVAAVAIVIGGMPVFGLNNNGSDSNLILALGSVIFVAATINVAIIVVLSSNIEDKDQIHHGTSQLRIDGQNTG